LRKVFDCQAHSERFARMLRLRTYPALLVVAWLFLHFQGHVKCGGPTYNIPEVRFMNRASRFVEPPSETTAKVWLKKRDFITDPSYGIFVASNCTIGYDTNATTYSKFRIEPKIVYFPANGSINETVQIKITPDGKMKDNATVVLKLDSCITEKDSTIRIKSPSNHTMTISNRDEMIQFRDLNLTVKEGGPAVQLIVERKGWLGSAAEFKLTTNPSGQLDLKPDQSYVFKQFASTVTISISATKDDEKEGDVKVQIGLSLVGNNPLITNNKSIVTITIKDSVPQSGATGQDPEGNRQKNFVLLSVGIALLGFFG